jgi:Zn-dependent M28 family amino/carboxypeptidase
VCTGARRGWQMREAPLQTAVGAVSAERIGDHIAALEGVRHPSADPQALERAARYIEGHLAGLGYELEARRFRFKGDGHLYRNIIATPPGAGAGNERVLVLAHYDTVAESPGADDNASGVAVLLELATVLRPVRFRHTLQLAAINLEEPPPRPAGSLALARTARREGWSIAAVVNLESVGYGGSDVAQQTPEGLPIRLPATGDFIGIVANRRSAALAERIAEAARNPRVALPQVTLVVPGNGEAVMHTRRGDHASFWDNGFSAVMLTDTANFRNPHYHRPSDSLATLNLGFAAGVCRVVATAVGDVAGARGSSG